MNVQYLRKSLKIAWLTYYRDNRDWLARLGVWVDCGGQRRPSSGFILGTLSTVEPQLTSLLPLIVDLSNDPDRIILALGLNFNPDDELEAMEAAKPPKMLLSSSAPLAQPVLEAPVLEKPAAELPLLEKPIQKNPALERPAGRKPLEQKPLAQKPVEQKPVDLPDSKSPSANAAARLPSKIDESCTGVGDRE